MRNWGAGPVSPSLGPTGLRHAHYELKLHHLGHRAGPCALLGWVPYWTPFVGAWSFVLQLYYGPKVLYRMREGRALLILALLVAAMLLESATRGTTVGF